MSLVPSVGDPHLTNRAEAERQLELSRYHADRLERELDEARRERDAAFTVLRDLGWNVTAGVEDWPRLVKEQAETQAQLTAAHDALREIVRWGAPFDAKGSHSKRVVDRAKKALAAAPQRTHAPSESVGQNSEELQCGEDCTRCSGEYCDKHFTDPCECDVVDRHSPNEAPRPGEQEKDDV